MAREKGNSELMSEIDRLARERDAAERKLRRIQTGIEEALKLLEDKPEKR